MSKSGLGVSRHDCIHNYLSLSRAQACEVPHRRFSNPLFKLSTRASLGTQKSREASSSSLCRFSLRQATGDQSITRNKSLNTCTHAQTVHTHTHTHTHTYVYKYLWMPQVACTVYLNPRKESASFCVHASRLIVSSSHAHSRWSKVLKGLSLHDCM